MVVVVVVVVVVVGIVVVVGLVCTEICFLLSDWTFMDI